MVRAVMFPRCSLDLPECSKEPGHLASLELFLRAWSREGKAPVRGNALEVGSGGPTFSCSTT